MTWESLTAKCQAWRTPQPDGEHLCEHAAEQMMLLIDVCESLEVPLPTSACLVPPGGILLAWEIGKLRLEWMIEADKKGGMQPPELTVWYGGRVVGSATFERRE